MIIPARVDVFPIDIRTANFRHTRLLALQFIVTNVLQDMSISCTATDRMGPRPPHCWCLWMTGIDTHPVVLLWARDQLVAEAATYTTQNRHKTRTKLSAGLKPAIPAIRCLQTCALDRMLQEPTETNSSSVCRRIPRILPNTCSHHKATGLYPDLA